MIDPDQQNRHVIKGYQHIVARTAKRASPTCNCDKAAFAQGTDVGMTGRVAWHDLR